MFFYQQNKKEKGAGATLLQPAQLLCDQAPRVTSPHVAALESLGDVLALIWRRCAHHAMRKAELAAMQIQPKKHPVLPEAGRYKEGPFPEASRERSPADPLSLACGLPELLTEGISVVLSH